MYQSPIEIYHRMVDDINEKTDELVVNACMEVGVKVDREELIKMAEYDRGQYEKGYTEGQVSGAIVVLEHLIGSIDSHIANVRGDDARHQHAYELGERHIKELVELYLRRLKDGAIKINGLGGNSV